MVSLTGIVWIVIYLLIAIAVLGLVWWLIGFIQERIGGPAKAYDIVRVIFVVLVVLLIIFFLLSLLNNQPMFRS